MNPSKLAISLSTCTVSLVRNAKHEQSGAEVRRSELRSATSRLQ